MVSSNLRSLALTAALAASALGTGCASTLQSVGIESVDSLSTRVERVHLEIQLSKEAVYDSILVMGELFQPNFEGDAAEALEAFVRSTETCQQRANDMRNQVVPMRNAAQEVFESRQLSVDAISSASMQDRAQRRLDDSQGRFAKVENSAINSQTQLDELIVRLRDVALFLGHDFSREAVEEVRADAMAIRDDARVLSTVLDQGMDACHIYVRDSAILGQSSVQFEIEAQPSNEQGSAN